MKSENKPGRRLCDVGTVPVKSEKDAGYRDIALSEKFCVDGEPCVVKSEMEVGQIDAGWQDLGCVSCTNDGEFEEKKSDTDVGQSEVEPKNTGRTFWIDDGIVSVKSERELGRSEAGLSAGCKLSELVIQCARNWLVG